MRTSNGCWTCRLRRKRCDENKPACAACAALLIACHFDLNNKPEWMDGGVRQDRMAEQIKREIKEKANNRREERATQTKDPESDEPSPNLIRPIPHTEQSVLESTLLSLQRPGCKLSRDDAYGKIAFGRSDTVLLAFYLEHVLPFLFPFYRPSLLQGGRAWIFELMISSPVVRQATLCHSSFFYSLARGTAQTGTTYDEMLRQTADTFKILRQALQVINGSSISSHLHGAVRIMASIVQMHRFEIAVLSFHNWQTHLNAAVVLFEQILQSASEVRSPWSPFNTIVNRLGASAISTSRLSIQSGEVPSAEQAAFLFSSALIMFDDIIASTVLQARPRLYEYHQSLLGGLENLNSPPIDMERVIGVKNWILLQIGEISKLEAWKHACTKASNLDILELARYGTAIRECLLSHLMRLETEPEMETTESPNPLVVFPPPPRQCPSVSQLWAHAALIYLSTVVSGWQTASIDVRYHVSRVIELLKGQRTPALLRTMAWPLCVAGFLAEPAQEVHFTDIVETLQPIGVFGTVHKAFELIKNVWTTRDGENANRNLASCFRSQDDLVLLI